MCGEAFVPAKQWITNTAEPNVLFYKRYKEDAQCYTVSYSCWELGGIVVNTNAYPEVCGSSPGIVVNTNVYPEVCGSNPGSDSLWKSWSLLAYAQ